MSNYIPRWTPEMLEEYKRNLAQKIKAPVKTTPSPAQRPAERVPSALPPLVPYLPSESVAVPLRASEAKQTKTEEKYNRECLGGRGRFEAVTLRLPGGGRYTPDFMTIDDGVVTFHEVKGSYRLGSQGRAFTAFHDAAAYYPMWRFVWAHWTGKAWDVSTFDLTAIGKMKG